MVKIWIDAGHGGTDRANVGPTGYVEADGVLKISKYLRDQLMTTGAFEIKMSREDDTFVDVRTRGDLAAAWGADLFISEHTNGNDGKPRGVEVYESVDITDDVFADKMSAAVASAMGTFDRGGRSWESINYPGEDYLGVIDAAQDGGCKHVLLVESGFHDNIEDEALLKNDTILRNIAKAQAGVICNFFGITYNSGLVTNTILILGSSGSEVLQLQKDLTELGYPLGTPDGSFGPLTDTAVRTFQLKYFGDADGAAGPQTQSKIAELLVIQRTPIVIKNPIVGNNVATADQLYAICIAKNMAPKISTSLYNLCNMFLEEGTAEGIRGDIAFCQAMKETGYLQYGGLAKPEWNNYCGLGVTGIIGADGIAVGNKFPDARTGVRAQIQHLKGYATTAPLNGTCVDIRYQYVSKGVSPNWEDLNGKWAIPGIGYGEDIVAIYKKALLFAKDDPLIPAVIVVPTEPVGPLVPTDPEEKINISLVNKILDLLVQWFSKLLGK